MVKTYNRIEVMKGLEIIRHRPGQFVGNFEENGYHCALMNLLREIVGNSVDEFMGGHASWIHVHLDSRNNRVLVLDDGRGIPNDVHEEEGVNQLELACCRMYTGAKYAKDKDTAFKFAIGMNGIGLTAANALSESFGITSIRDGREVSVRASKGVIQGEPFQVPHHGESRGTTVEWVVDQSILPFKYNPDHIKRYLQEVAWLNAGLRLNFVHQFSDLDQHEYLYFERRGIQSFLQKVLNGDKTIARFNGLEGMKEDQYGFEVALAITRSSGETYHSFVNGNRIEQASTPVVALRQSFARAVLSYIDEHAKIAKKWRDKDGKLKIEPADVRSGITAIIKILHVNPSFDAQTKTKLINRDISGYMQECLPGLITGWLLSHPSESEEIVKQTLQFAEARIAAQKARERVKNGSEKEDRASISLNIFEPPLSDSRDENILYLLEGQSAKGSLTEALKERRPDGKLYKENIGGLALRGNILNTLECTMKQALRNTELATLVQVAGLNPDNPDDLSGLRFREFRIATDMDAGGDHISILITTFFVRHFPAIIQQGRLRRVVTPLFEITNRRTKEVYMVYPDEKPEDALVRVGLEGAKAGQDYLKKRNKGLGELSRRSRLTLVENPRLEEYQVEDPETLLPMFLMFSGVKHVETRRDVITGRGLTFYPDEVDDVLVQEMEVV